MTKAFEVLQHVLFPITLMFISARYLPITIYELVRNQQFSTLFSPSAFKYAWFSRFWKYYGPLTKENSKPVVQPLLQLAHGVVLDIGPGSGEWLALFDESKITKIYGVEPNRDHHALLRERIIQAGLSDIYFIVPVGVEDLNGKGAHGGKKKDGGWVQREEVDCIATIQCLCSVPNSQSLISRLYTYLKPGGTWLVFEHVVMKRGGILITYQAVVDIIWPQFLGGCSLTRDTELWLREAGDWSKIDLKQPADEPVYRMAPNIIGTLIK